MKKPLWHGYTQPQLNTDRKKPLWLGTDMTDYAVRIHKPMMIRKAKCFGSYTAAFTSGIILYIYYDTIHILILYIY